jgi:hypothetical protein
MDGVKVMERGRHVRCAGRRLRLGMEVGAGQIADLSARGHCEVLGAVDATPAGREPASGRATAPA